MKIADTSFEFALECCWPEVGNIIPLLHIVHDQYCFTSGQPVGCLIHLQVYAVSLQSIWSGHLPALYSSQLFFPKNYEQLQRCSVAFFFLFIIVVILIIVNITTGPERDLNISKFTCTFFLCTYMFLCTLLFRAY